MFMIALPRCEPLWLKLTWGFDRASSVCLNVWKKRRRRRVGSEKGNKHRRSVSFACYLLPSYAWLESLRNNKHRLPSLCSFYTRGHFTLWKVCRHIVRLIFWNSLIESQNRWGQLSDSLTMPSKRIIGIGRNPPRNWWAAGGISQRCIEI